jgi:putative transcriptional regulator
MATAFGTGSLLVAAAGVLDDNFDGSVVLLLDADDGGTLGVIVNRRTDVGLASALPQWADLADTPAVLFEGGPVSRQGAICLARPAGSEDPPGWRPIAGRTGMLSLDTPVEIAVGAYSHLRVFAGYAGWSAGQLQDELACGCWHVVDIEPQDPFDDDPATLWRRVLRRQGGDLALWSTWTPKPDLN